MAKKPSKNWALLIFSLPFASVGLGFLFISILPTLYEGAQMSTWQPAQAKVLSVDLESHSGEDGTTYQAFGSYEYQVNGINYYGDRLGISSGADNVGTWHRTMSGTLKNIRERGLTVTVYYNPSNPAEAIVDPKPRWNLLAFKMIFVLVFGGAGIGLFYWVIQNNRKHIDPGSIPDAANKPWLTHKDWASPVIYSNAKHTLYIAWGVSAFWMLLTAPAMLAIPSELAKGNIAILAVALFPLVGVGLIVWAVKSTRRWQAIGRTPLTLDPYPGSIGGQVGGHIDTNIRHHANHKFSIALSSVYSYSSGSGKNRSQHERVNWHASGYADMQISSSGTRLVFCFDVPEGLPESELKADRYNYWKVTLKGLAVSTVAGVETDIERQFVIPVFATAKPSQSIRVNSSNHQQAEREVQLEQVVDIQQTREGLNLHFPMGRNAKMNFSFLGFGVLFSAAGFFAGFMGAPLFLVFIFVAVGGAIALGSLYSLINTLNTTVSHSNITTFRSVLGVCISHNDTPTDAVAKLRIHRTGSSTQGSDHREYFAIRAHLNNGKKITLAESLCGQDAAQELAESIAYNSGIALEARPVSVKQIRAERNAAKK